MILNKYKNFSWSFTYISVQLSLFMMMSLHVFPVIKLDFLGMKSLSAMTLKKIEEEKRKRERNGSGGEGRGEKKANSYKYLYC